MAMPVILTNIDEQKLWLMEGDEAMLRPYESEMEFDQLPTPSNIFSLRKSDVLACALS